MKVTYRTALEIASHEAITRKAYLDRVARRPIWTWSIGITHLTGHDVERYKDNPQTLEHCLTIYVWALDKFAETVRRTFAGHTLTEEQFAAALSFHYNTGSIHKATWVKQWKAGDTAAARRSIMNWTTPKAITGRRMKERDLFFDGKWSASGKILEYDVNANYSPVNPHPVDISEPLKTALAKHYGAPFKTTPKPQPKPQPKPPHPVAEGLTGGGGGVVAVSGIETGNWWLIGIGALLIVAAVVIFILRRRG